MGCQGQSDGAYEVNLYLAQAFLHPLAGLADDDEAVAYYWSLDPDDEATVRKIIRTLLVPYYHRWNAQSQAKGKLALRYTLSFRRDLCEAMFDGLLPPFDPPSEPCRFFEWLWTELFGDEDYHLANEHQYVLASDIEATNYVTVQRNEP